MTDCACDMKGFLSFLLLWELREGKKTGKTLADALEARRGTRPSPGTIYPALKELANKGLIEADESKAYTLTPKGRKELDAGVKLFCGMFSDYREMERCCRR